MRKLKLALENLAVESFDTTAAEKPRGTVFGEECSCYTACTCPGCPTCDATCQNTCEFTCDDRTCVTCDATCPASCAGPCASYYCTSVGEFSCLTGCQAN